MKKILLTAASAAFALGAYAQGGEKGPFLTNRACDNWFVSLGGGVNVYAGEGDFGRFPRLAPALDFSVGKWFTPAVGARLQYAGLSARGWTGDGSAPFVSGDPKGRHYPEKFGANFVHADFLWNVSSALGGYKQTRLWEFIPFAGFGGAVASGNGKRNYELAFTAGLVNKIRVSKAIDINIELRGMLVNQGFDGTTGGIRPEGMGSATVGVTYRFNKRGFDRYHRVADADYTPYNDKISSLEGLLAAESEKAARLAEELSTERSMVPEPQIETEVEIRYLVPRTVVFFEIGKSTLDGRGKAAVEYLAEAIKKISVKRKFKIVGGADNTTGSAQINRQLSERRALAVCNALVAAGVNPSQLEVVIGGTEKLFGSDEPALNRAVVVTE